MEAFSQRFGSEGFYTWNIFISGYTVDKNIIGAPKIQNYYEFIMLSNYLFFQYCNCNIRLFSIAPCNYRSLSLINFWSNFFASFLHFPFYSYCSSNYRNIISWRFFLLLEANAINFHLLFAIAFKIEKRVAITIFENFAFW